MLNLELHLIYGIDLTETTLPKDIFENLIENDFISNLENKYFIGKNFVFNTNDVFKAIENFNEQVVDEYNIVIESIISEIIIYLEVDISEEYHREDVSKTIYFFKDLEMKHLRRFSVIRNVL